MKATTTFMLLLMVAVAAFAQKKDNPYSVYCDYHYTYFYKSGQEYPSGKCYDVYKHSYFESGKTYSHKMTMPCAR